MIGKPPVQNADRNNAAWQTRPAYAPQHLDTSPANERFGRAQTPNGYAFILFAVD